MLNISCAVACLGLDSGICQVTSDYGMEENKLIIL